jgi:hypothetical protein
LSDVIIQDGQISKQVITISRFISQNIKEMQANIVTLEWFFGVRIRTQVMKKPTVTVAEMIGRRHVIQCTVPECLGFFSSTHPWTNIKSDA